MQQMYMTQLAKCYRISTIKILSMKTRLNKLDFRRLQMFYAMEQQTIIFLTISAIKGNVILLFVVNELKDIYLWCIMVII